MTKSTVKTHPECKTCQHPKRALIDKLLVKGKPVNAVAKAHRLSEASVRRHASRHIRAMVAKAKAQRERRQTKVIMGVEAQYERDGQRLDKEIAKAKDATERQGWYTVKLRWYNLGLKYAFLSAALRRPSQHNGNGKPHIDDALPDAVQRVIDAVVSDE